MYGKKKISDGTSFKIYKEWADAKISGSKYSNDRDC